MRAYNMTFSCISKKLLLSDFYWYDNIDYSHHKVKLMPAAHENSGEETSLSDSEPLKPPPQNLTHPDQHRVPVHTHDYEHYPDIHNGAWIPPQSPIYRGPNPVTHSPHPHTPTPSDGSHPHQPPPQDIHTQYNPQPYPSNPQYPVYHNDYPANGAKGNGFIDFMWTETIVIQTIGYS